MRKLQMQNFKAMISFLVLFLSIKVFSQQEIAIKNKKDTTYKNIKTKYMTPDTLKAYAPVNGLNMYYEVIGTGKPVIVLHGGFGNTGLFMPNVTAFTTNHKVILVDLQGHGRTGDIERPIIPDSIANDIASLIKQLNLGRTTIIGYSLGGMVALRLAIQHPELLDRAVLISVPFKRKGWFPDLLAQQDQMGPELAEALKPSPLYESYLKRAPKPEDWTKFVIKMGEFIKRDYDWSKEVAAIKLPVLLIAADADGVMPDHMIEFFKLLGGGLRDAGWDGSGRPSSQLAIIPGQTHYDLFMSPFLSSVIMPFINNK